MTLTQYVKAFGLHSTPVALLVPGVNTLPCSHRFKSLLYTKILLKSTSPNLYYQLIQPSCSVPLTSSHVKD